MGLPICCVLCKHFYFDPGHEDYSDLTPGESTIIGCNKDHYRMEAFDTTEEKYRENMLKANTCSDFEKADFIKES